MLFAFGDDFGGVVVEVVEGFVADGFHAGAAGVPQGLLAVSDGQNTSGQTDAVLSMDEFVCVGSRGLGLGRVFLEICQSVVGIGCLRIPEEKEEGFLSGFVLFVAQAGDGRLKPEILVGGKEHVNQAKVLIEREVVLDDEDGELGSGEDVECGGGGVVTEGSIFVDEEDVVPELDVADVGVSERIEDDFVVEGIVGERAQEACALVQEEGGIVEVG